MHPKDAEGIANSIEPDQTAPVGTVWSESALFAQTFLSEKLGSLRYVINLHDDSFVGFFQQRKQTLKYTETTISQIVRCTYYML